MELLKAIKSLQCQSLGLQPLQSSNNESDTDNCPDVPLLPLADSDKEENEPYASLLNPQYANGLVTHPLWDLINILDDDPILSPNFASSAQRIITNFSEAFTY